MKDPHGSETLALCTCTAGQPEGQGPILHYVSNPETGRRLQVRLEALRVHLLPATVEAVHFFTCPQALRVGAPMLLAMPQFDLCDTAHCEYLEQVCSRSRACDHSGGLWRTALGKWARP